MNIRKNSFLNSIIILTSGSMVAQLITVLVSPLTTRLFTADQIGVFSLFTTAVSIFSPILSLRYDLSIVTEEDEKMVYSLIVASSVLCCLMSALVAIGYYVYFAYDTSLAFSPLLASFVAFVLIFLTGLINILMSHNNRLKEYKLMTSVYVARTTIQNVGIIILGLLKTGAIGLLFSQIIGLIFGLKRQSKSLLSKWQELKQVTWPKTKEALNKHRRQVYWSTPAAFANAFSYYAINYFVGNMFGTATLGYYSISFRVLGLPLNVFSVNVSKVFFERASREHDAEGRFLRSFYYTLAIMTAIAIPMLLLLMIFSPLAFAVLFGKEWRVAGEYVQILAPMFMLRFIVGGVVVSSIIANKQILDFVIQITLTVISVLLFIIAKLMQLQLSQYLLMVSVCFSIIYAVYILLLRNCAKGKRSDFVIEGENDDE